MAELLRSAPIPVCIYGIQQGSRSLAGEEEEEEEEKRRFYVPSFPPPPPTPPFHAFDFEAPPPPPPPPLSFLVAARLHFQLHRGGGSVKIPLLYSRTLSFAEEQSNSRTLPLFLRILLLASLRLCQGGGGGLRCISRYNKAVQSICAFLKFY